MDLLSRPRLDLGIWLAFFMAQRSFRRADNLSHNVYRFCLGFVIRPGSELTEEPKSYELKPNDPEKGQGSVAEGASWPVLGPGCYAERHRCHGRLT